MPRRLQILGVISALAVCAPTPASAAGPDLTISELFGAFGTPEDFLAFRYYGKVDGISGYSVGAFACNPGDQPVSWVSSTSAHPVESRHLYRLMDGRLEQIGISWVKHGFFALALDDCLLGCPPGALSGSVLDINCTHPTNSALFGNQFILGPRGHINAFDGTFPYHFSLVPFPAIGLQSVIGRRLQVHDTDLDPALNPGAQYFGEAQIIAADDASAGNGSNNVTHQAVDVTETSPGIFGMALTGAAVPQQPAINAWQAADPTVTLTTVQVPGEGLFILACKTLNVGANVWRYEYALYNQTSDRSAGWFSVPIANAPFITNVGFHDVDYHSADGLPDVAGTFPNTDWAVTETADALAWATDDYATDPQANALRWGTLYNFWFEMNRPPIIGQVEIGLFKPGSPTSILVTVSVPDPSADPDVIPASSDWAIAVLLAACLGAGVIALRRRGLLASATL